MRAADPGPLLYAYYPIPANPMSVAILLLGLIGTFVLGPLLAAPSGLWPLGGVCFVPLTVLVAWILAFKPSPTFVYEDGIDVSLPLWRRLAGETSYVRWGEIRDAYPASYEVAGSSMSPFASSAGTLVHVGLGLETRDGRRRVVRFTPGAIRSFRAESPAFQEAIGIIRARFARAGQPMVTTASALSDADVLRLQAQAREPLISIASVFFAFFLPPALVAAILMVATTLGSESTVLVGVAATILALVPPSISIVATRRRSERRNEVLSGLAKFQESRRQGRGPSA
jgi:hypothetical protein